MVKGTDWELTLYACFWWLKTQSTPRNPLKNMEHIQTQKGRAPAAMWTQVLLVRGNGANHCANRLVDKFTFLAESQQRGQPHKRVGSCLFVPSDEAVICALCEQQSSSLSLHADTGWDLLWSSTVSSNFEKSFRRSSKSSIKTVELGVHLSSSSSSMCHRINQTNMGLMIKNRSSEVHCSSFRVLGASICTEDVLEHNWKWKSKWKIRCKLNKIIILPQSVKKNKL